MDTRHPLGIHFQRRILLFLIFPSHLVTLSYLISLDHISCPIALHLRPTPSISTVDFALVLEAVLSWSDTVLLPLVAKVAWSSRGRLLAREINDRLPGKRDYLCNRYVYFRKFDSPSLGDFHLVILVLLLWLTPGKSISIFRQARDPQSIFLDGFVSDRRPRDLIADLATPVASGLRRLSGSWAS